MNPQETGGIQHAISGLSQRQKKRDGPSSLSIERRLPRRELRARIRHRLAIHTSVVVRFEAQVHGFRHIHVLIDGELTRSDLEIEFARRNDGDLQLRAWPVVSEIHPEPPGGDTIPLHKGTQRGVTGRFLGLGQASQLKVGAAR